MHRKEKYFILMNFFQKLSNPIVAYTVGKIMDQVLRLVP